MKTRVYVECGTSIRNLPLESVDPLGDQYTCIGSEWSSANDTCAPAIGTPLSLRTEPSTVASAGFGREAGEGLAVRSPEHGTPSLANQEAPFFEATRLYV